MSFLLARAGLVAAVLCSLAVGRVDAQTTVKPKAKWTVMFFVDSDNNLEEAQLRNMMQALQARSNPDLRLIALMDRSKKHSSTEFPTLGDWTGGKTFEITANKVIEITNHGDVNMGDGKFLAEFVDQAVAHAPAEKYGLFFSDHGSQWRGINDDGSNKGDRIELPELRNALMEVANKHGALELVHFDACLMGCIETAANVAPYAKWMTSSPDVISSGGSNYRTILNDLGADLSMDGMGLGNVILTNFDERYLSTDHEVATGMALYDLSQMPGLVKAMSYYSSMMKLAHSSSQNDIAICFSNAYQYYKGGWRSTDRGFVDIGDLMSYSRMREFKSVPGVQIAVRDVESSLRDVVVSYVKGRHLENTYGMSVYIPENRVGHENSQAAYSGLYFSRQADWTTLMSLYNKTYRADRGTPNMGPVAASSTKFSSGEEITIDATLGDKDIHEVFMTVGLPDGDRNIIIGQMPLAVSKTGELQEKWDGQWLYLHNVENGVICPIQSVQLLDPQDPEGDICAYVPIQIRRGGEGDWIDCTAAFVIEMDEEGVYGTLTYVGEDSPNQFTEFEIQSGDHIRPVYVTISEAGVKTPVPDESADGLLVIREKNELAVIEGPLPPGDYNLGFRAIDYAGNEANRSIKIVIEEEENLIVRYIQECRRDSKDAMAQRARRIAEHSGQPCLRLAISMTKR